MISTNIVPHCPQDIDGRTGNLVSYIVPGDIIEQNTHKRIYLGVRTLSLCDQNDFCEKGS